MDWMAENCAKTCGKCGGVTVVKGMYSDDLSAATSFLEVKLGRGI